MKERLLAEGYGWKLITKVSEAEWVQWGVPKGARTVVVDSQKSWQHAIVNEQLATAQRRSFTTVASNNNEAGQDSNNNEQEFVLLD